MEKAYTLSPWQWDNALHDTLPMQSHTGNKLAKLKFRVNVYKSFDEWK